VLERAREQQLGIALGVRAWAGGGGAGTGPSNAMETDREGHGTGRGMGQVEGCWGVRERARGAAPGREGALAKWGGAAREKCETAGAWLASPQPTRTDPRPLCLCLCRCPAPQHPTPTLLLPPPRPLLALCAGGGREGCLLLGTVFASRNGADSVETAHTGGGTVNLARCEVRAMLWRLRLGR